MILFYFKFSLKFYKNLSITQPFYPSFLFWKVVSLLIYFQLFLLALLFGEFRLAEKSVTA